MTIFSKILVFTAFIISNFSAVGQAVPAQVLKDAANRFMTDNFYGGARKIQSVIPFMSDNINTLNLVTLEPEGWILLSADLKVKPVIGFSNTGHFIMPDENRNDPMSNWIKLYQLQIKQIVANKLFKAQNEWESARVSKFANVGPAGPVNVNPFMDANWGQGANWNKFCPVDVNGPGGHVYVGCVAVSMAQAMSVFKTPVRGQDYYNYTDPKYGTQFANFGNTSYNWDSISFSQADSFNALLLYHCAVAVNMTFGADGSGTQTSRTVSALKNYFSFSHNILYKTRSGTDEQWRNLLNDQLSRGRPIIYAGDADDGKPGHAFNIDGVINSTYFHINWGWSSSNNGYFTLDALNPGSSDFNKNQAAVFGIQPLYYPTDIRISDSIVKNYQPKGSLVGILHVIDEATDNGYTFKLACDSTYGQSGWIMNYFLDGDSLKTGRVFAVSGDNSDSVIISLKDKYNHTLSKKILLRIGNLSTGISLQDEEQYDHFAVYPSLATDMIFFQQKTQKNITSFRIYSISGALMQRIENYDAVKGIQISALKKGFYILRAELEEHKVIYLKFIKQ